MELKNLLGGAVAEVHKNIRAAPLVKGNSSFMKNPSKIYWCIMGFVFSEFFS
jgi:hypothetical protein